MRTRLGFSLLATCAISVAAYGQAIGTIAGGRVDDLHPAISSALARPLDVAVDAAGNPYIADQSNHCIRRIDRVTGVFTTVAGNGIGTYGGDGGPATSASLRYPGGVALDAAGNLYIADTSNNRIRVVDAATKTIRTIAGNGNAGFSGDGGPATQAQFNFPESVALDSRGNLYIADTGNSRIRKVDATTSTVTTIAGIGDLGFSGDGGPATAARLNSPYSVEVGTSGNVYIADTNNSVVRKIVAATGIISTVAGTTPGGFAGDGGPATAAKLLVPIGLTIDAAENLYVSDSFNNRVRRVEAATGIITTLAGSTRGFGGDSGPAESALLNDPAGLAVDAAGNVFVADTNNNRLRKIDAATKTIVTVSGGPVGDGAGPFDAQLAYPTDVAIDRSGNIFITDTYDSRVRRLDAATKVVTTVAGGGSTFPTTNDLATSVALSRPSGVVFDAAGNLYIADGGYFTIFKVDAVTQRISPFAGSGKAVSNGDGGPAVTAGITISAPAGLALDVAGNLFIADTFANSIRRVDAATGIISTIAGSSAAGFSGDSGPANLARLNSPYGVTLDAAGNLFIADGGNHRIRRVDHATGIITTVAGSDPGFAGDGGPATASKLRTPTAVAVDAAGNIYISDTGNHRIRKITASTGIITTIAGRELPGFSGDFGPAAAAALNFPLGLIVDAAGNLYVADSNNGRIRMIGTAQRNRAVRKR